MKRILFVLAIVFGCSGFGVRAEAAVLYPFSYVTDVPLNSTVTVDLRLDSEGQNVNAVELELVYDPAVLEVLGTGHSDSFMTLWTEEPNASVPGRVTLSGGRPDGSLVVNGNVASISFKTLRIGKTTLAIQPALSGVYINDGQGTAAELSGRTLELHVLDPVVLLSQPTSPTHPIDGVWSSLRDVELTWMPHKNAVVSYQLSRDPVLDPDEVVEDNNGRTVFPALENGVWYLTFMERFSGQAWSAIFRREVRIDATPPQPFELSVIRENNGQTFVSFSAQDGQSGIARYVARIERSRWWTPWTKVVSEQAVAGPFTLTDVSTISRISVTAYDAAGNTQSTSISGPDRNIFQALGVVLGAALLLCGTLVWLIRQARHTSSRKRRRS